MNLFNPDLCGLDHNDYHKLDVTFIGLVQVCRAGLVIEH